MTEKKKAEQLIKKLTFAHIYFTDKKEGARINAKICALNAVEFHIEELENIQFNYDEDLSDDINYYKRVIQEINSL